MSIGLGFRNFSVFTEDLPKGILGEIMVDIMFCDSYFCGNKEAYLEMLEYTAKEIISKVLRYSGCDFPYCDGCNRNCYFEGGFFSKFNIDIIDPKQTKLTMFAR